MLWYSDFYLLVIRTNIVVLPILLLCVATIALIIMPQRWQLLKYQQKYKKLQPGVRITTQTGDTGIIRSVSQNFVVIVQDDGVVCEVSFQAIDLIHE